MLFNRQFEIVGEGRRFAALLFSIGLIQVAAYYLSGALVNGPGDLAIAQPDTLLYCQAARRIVEGHPFSFSAGTAVSTGTTSVLYPFLLAIPYALGLKGGALFTAGFVLNAIFYFLFLSGWSVAFRRWFPPKLAWFALVLLCLFPQTAFCALSQSDTGLWMAVSALFVAGLASNRFCLYAPMLLIGPWVRPEGALIAVAFFAVSLFRPVRRDKILAIVALLSAAGVWAFNGWLTGVGGFSSVANKGYFTTHPFGVAVVLVFAEFIRLIEEVVLGLSASAPRIAFAVPFLGAVAFVCGVFTRKWRWPADSVIALLALAACGGLATVAQSGWQGTNFDRYLAWMMPLVVSFSASGWWWAYERLAAYPARKACLALPVLFAASASVYAWAAFNKCCDDSDRFVKFARRIDAFLPAEASVASSGGCGIAYLLGDRRLAHVSGIYSPEFSARTPGELAEILKNEPQVRFDYWHVDAAFPLPESVVNTFGPSVLTGPNADYLRRANWAPFDAAHKVPDCRGLRLVDRVDVGYAKDERRAGYRQVFHYAMRPFDELLKVGRLPSGETIVDAGKLTVGYDEMTVSGLTPGRDLWVVMRTVSSVKASRDEYTGKRTVADYAFDDELDLHARVDGVEVACCHAHVSTNDFTDASFMIPGRFVTAPEQRIGFNGEHASFGYWYYQ